MINKSKTKKLSSERSGIIWTAVLFLLVISGFYLVIKGTASAAVGRYISPPEIFFGVVLLYVFSTGAAFATVNEVGSLPFLIEFRKNLINKLNETSAAKLRNMALLLIFFMVAFSITESTGLRIPPFAKSFIFGLFVNMFSAVVSSVGIFGWTAYLFLSKNLGEKS